jgi:hypothetical protein
MSPSVPGKAAPVLIRVAWDSGDGMQKLWIAGLALFLAAPAWADSGRDLVRFCGQSASLCGSDFQSDELTSVLKANACVPANLAAAQGAILTWLGKHPRTARLEIAKAVAQASKTLWPCHK